MSTPEQIRADLNAFADKLGLRAKRWDHAAAEHADSTSDVALDAASHANGLRELETEFRAILTALAPHFTQQEEDADRWHFVACSPQTALMLGTKADPNAKDFPWRDECDRLVDAARLNTEIKTK